MRIEYNKLIRDKIPEIIQETRKNYQIAEYDEKSYKEALLEKLVEEANEVKKSSDNHIITELADLLEVYETIINAFDLSNKEIVFLKEEKFAKRGGFQKKIRLLWVEE